MRSIDADELARMAAVQITSFNDLCDIYHFVGSTDSDTGEQLVTYDTSPSLATVCGLAVGSEQRNERGQIITIDADAVLRVAASQSIAVQDKVIARGKTYAVDGLQLGRNVQIANLKEVKI